jgi:hypothetical protein
MSVVFGCGIAAAQHGQPFTRPWHATTWFVIHQINTQWETTDITNPVFQLRNYAGMSPEGLEAVRRYMRAARAAMDAVGTEQSRTLCGDSGVADDARERVMSVIVNNVHTVLHVYDAWKFREWLSLQGYPSPAFRAFAPRLNKPGSAGSDMSTSSTPVSLVCKGAQARLLER